MPSWGRSGSAHDLSQGMVCWNTPGSFGFPGTTPTVMQRLLGAFVYLESTFLVGLPDQWRAQDAEGFVCISETNGPFHTSVLVEKAAAKHLLPTPHRAHQALQILPNKWQQPSGGSAWHGEWHGGIPQKPLKGEAAGSLLSHFSISGLVPLWGSSISSPLSLQRWQSCPDPLTPAGLSLRSCTLGYS